MRELDKLCKELALHRHPFCVTCLFRKGIKNTSLLSPGHLITRRKKTVRWDMENVFTQCTGCNCLHEYQPEHFTLWFITTFGKDKYEELVLRSNTPRHFSRLTLMELREQLQLKVNNL